MTPLAFTERHSPSSVRIGCYQVTYLRRRRGQSLDKTACLTLLLRLTINNTPVRENTTTAAMSQLPVPALSSSGFTFSKGKTVKLANTMLVYDFSIASLRPDVPLMLASLICLQGYYSIVYRFYV